MVNNIHYLIKNPSEEKGGLIYPSEVSNEKHYAVGSLYILGNKIQNKYILHAINDEKILKLSLKRIKANEYLTTVDGIGDFRFFAERVSMQRYSGNNADIEGVKVQRRLRFYDDVFAETTCEQHKFYFIGYSDILND